MRIRKRWPPLPSQYPPVSSVGASSESSALHPTSSEDKTRRPLLRAAPNHQYLPQQEEDPHRSDLQLTVAGETNGDGGKHEGKQKKQTEGVDCMHRSHKQEERIGEEEEAAAAVAEEKRFASSNLRNESNMNGAAPSGLNLVQPSSSSQQVPARRWCEEERAVPLKKRKGNIEGKANNVTIMEKEKKMKTQVQPKPNKKRVGEEDDGIGCNGVKKRGRGGDGVVMEGSRCSRVNGRGWRCCQQTLVGYSLCEHHLGKGRLRSMSSVRSRAASPSPTIEPENNKVEPGLSLSSTSLEEANEQADEDDEEKPLKVANKRKKIGMVKARSISSLLGQSLHEPTVTPINHLLKL